MAISIFLDCDKASMAASRENPMSQSCVINVSLTCDSGLLAPDLGVLEVGNGRLTPRGEPE